MSQRTHAQKLELKDHFRRAAYDVNKTSSFRKGAFRRMLDVAKEPDLDATCKIFVTERVKDFIADFPEWQDEAINVVYDMCEDQDQKVRIEGYRALGKISQADSKWVPRNADVLVQLLLTDDPGEKLIIERALQIHIDIDLARTMSILCEQLAFKAELASEDERTLYARQRSAVIKFIADKFCKCILRAIRKNRDAGDTLYHHLITAKAFNSASPSETRLIVTDILLNFPACANGPTSAGNLILNQLLISLRQTIRSEILDVDKLSAQLEEVGQMIRPLTPTAHSMSSGKASSSVAARTTPAADPVLVFRQFLCHTGNLDCIPSNLGLKLLDLACLAYDTGMTFSDKPTLSGWAEQCSPILIARLTQYVLINGITDLSRTCLAYFRILRKLFVDSEETNGSVAEAVTAALHTFSENLDAALSNAVSLPDSSHSVRSADSKQQTLVADATKILALSRNLFKAIADRTSSNGTSIRQGVRRRRDPDPDKTGAVGPSFSRESSPATHSKPKPDHQVALSEARSGPEGEADDGSRIRKKLRRDDIDRANVAPEVGNSSAKFSLVDRIGMFRRPDLNRSGLHEFDFSRSDSSSKDGPSTSMPSASSAAGGSTHSKPKTIHSSTNGGVEISSTSSFPSSRQMESRRGSVTQFTDGHIFGASARGGGEISIRGAARCRKGDDKEARAPTLSLLERLSNGGGCARGDHEDGRKRKRA